MHLLYTDDLKTKEYLEKNHRLVQKIEAEKGTIYVFEGKPNEKFDKNLNLKYTVSNRLRF